MKKKGFSLTEIIITITIIGILALLGLNYVKRNAIRYNPLFYYSAYDALTKGFSDAVANDVPLTGVGLCNHFLTIWNIDSANSYCDPIAMVNSSDLKMIKKEPGILLTIKLNIQNVIADKKVVVDRFLTKMFDKTASPVYAGDYIGDMPGFESAGTTYPSGCGPCPCPPEGRGNDNHGGVANPLYQYCGFASGCRTEATLNADQWGNHEVAFPCNSTPNQCSNSQVWVESLGQCCNPCGENQVRSTTSCECISTCTYKRFINSLSSTYDISSFINTCHNTISYWADLTLENYCNCYNYRNTQNINTFVNYCGTVERWNDICAAGFDTCNCPSPRGFSQNGNYESDLSNAKFLLQCGHLGNTAWWVNYWNTTYQTACVSPYACNCDGYNSAVAANDIDTFINFCQNTAESWATQCQPEPSLPPETLVGSIMTQYGLKFEFYSSTSFVIGQNAEGQDIYSTYFTIKVSKPNSNLADVYFLVYPGTKEIIPISNQIADNKKILPTYLTSDANNFKNQPVTHYTTYRSAKCEKDTVDPSSQQALTPLSLAAYNHYVTTNNLTGTLPANYCDNTESINWIDSSAEQAPRSSMTLKTDSPKGLK